jgi:hypothetical protein
MQTRMKTIALTGAAFLISSGMAFAATPSGPAAQRPAGGMNHLKMAQNSGSGTGNSGSSSASSINGTSPGGKKSKVGLGVPAAMGSSGGTGGGKSGSAAGAGNAGANTSGTTGKKSSSTANVPAAVGSSGGTGGSKSGNGT